MSHSPALSQSKTYSCVWELAMYSSITTSSCNLNYGMGPALLDHSVLQQSSPACVPRVIKRLWNKSKKSQSHNVGANACITRSQQQFRHYKGCWRRIICLQR
eukprot:jgi/Ulvmu1/4295/UM002_0015.1